MTSIGAIVASSDQVTEINILDLNIAKYTLAYPNNVGSDLVSSIRFYYALTGAVLKVSDFKTKAHSGPDSIGPFVVHSTDAKHASKYAIADFITKHLKLPLPAGFDTLVNHGFGKRYDLYVRFAPFNKANINTVQRRFYHEVKSLGAANFAFVGSRDDSYEPAICVHSISNEHYPPNAPLQAIRSAELKKHVVNCLQKTPSNDAGICSLDAVCATSKSWVQGSPWNCPNAFDIKGEGRRNEQIFNSWNDEHPYFARQRYTEGKLIVVAPSELDRLHAVKFTAMAKLMTDNSKKYTKLKERQLRAHLQQRLEHMKCLYRASNYCPAVFAFSQHWMTPELLKFIVHPPVPRCMTEKKIDAQQAKQDVALNFGKVTHFVRPKANSKDMALLLDLTNATMKGLVGHLHAHRTENKIDFIMLEKMALVCDEQSIYNCIRWVGQLLGYPPTRLIALGSPKVNPAMFEYCQKQVDQRRAQQSVHAVGATSLNPNVFQ